jgi:hypothetical protein
MTLLDCILNMQGALSYCSPHGEYNLRTPMPLVDTRKREYGDEHCNAENEEQPVDKRISAPK